MLSLPATRINPATAAGFVRLSAYQWSQREEENYISAGQGRRVQKAWTEMAPGRRSGRTTESCPGRRGRMEIREPRQDRPCACAGESASVITSNLTFNGLREF